MQTETKKSLMSKIINQDKLRERIIAPRESIPLRPGAWTKLQLDIMKTKTFLKKGKFDVELAGIGQELHTLKKKKNSLMRKFHKSGLSKEDSIAYKDILTVNSNIESLRQIQWTIIQVKRFLSRQKFIETKSPRLAKLDMNKFIGLCKLNESIFDVTIWVYCFHNHLATNSKEDIASAWFSGTLEAV